MRNKRTIALISAILLFIGIGTAAFAASKAEAKQTEYEFGNLSNVLLSGGYAADYADGMVLFSDTENAGRLTLKNTESGSQRVIGDDNSSYINVVGRDIYYISSGSLFSIVKTDLGSEREVLVSSTAKLSNLFVSDECMYYLKGCSVIRYDFSSGSQTVVFSEPQMKAFIPKDGSIYWLKEKPSLHTQNMPCMAALPEGTEEEVIDFECFLYNPEHGESVRSNLANAIGTVASYDAQSVSSLALTARVGDKTIPTAEYPVGSYFTDNGEGCRDHGRGSCGWEDESLCNCKSFHNGESLLAVQCYGYARYVYYECFGEIGNFDSKTSRSIGSLDKGSVTEESFKALIQQTEPGAHMRVKYLRSNGYSVSSHSMIILDWNESGFSVCESNMDGRCGVSVRRIAYSEFVSTLVSVDFIMMPDDYPETEEDITDSSVSTPTDAERTEHELSTQVPETTAPVNRNDGELISQMLDLFLLAFEKFIDFSVMLINALLTLI